MASFEDTVRTLVRQQALQRNVTYNTVKTYAKSGRHSTTGLLAEVLRECGEQGFETKSLSSSIPENVRIRKELQRFFPPRVLKKRGRKKVEGRVPKPRTWARRPVKKEIPLPEARNRWAQAHGYRSWAHYSMEMLARRRGYRNLEEFGRALAKNYGRNYLAYAAGLMRAGFGDAEARKLADLVFSKKYAIPRKRLVEEAKRLAALPLLMPARAGRLMDASLPKYRKAWKRPDLQKYRKQWKK